MKARLALTVLFLATVSLAAQDIISARAGYLNYSEGRSAQAHRQLQDGELFSAARSRSELLLTPGSFLRLDRDSEIRMVSTRVSDPRIEMVWGLLGLEVLEIPKHSHITLTWGDYRDDRAIIVDQKGLFRFKAGNDVLRVAVQQGSLRLPGSNVKLKRGQSVELRASGISAIAKFNPKDTDLFDLWSSDRSGQLAAASFRSAHSYNPSGLHSSIWAYSSILGGYTYLPYSSHTYSPWGYAYYSPRYVQIVTATPRQSMNSIPSMIGSQNSGMVAPPQQAPPAQMSVSPPPAHHPVAPATPVKQ